MKLDLLGYFILSTTNIKVDKTIKLKSKLNITKMNNFNNDKI